LRSIFENRIMAVAIKLPRMSDTMEEGTIVSWFVKLGDTVKSSEMIADVETDKATMELENFEKGEVLYLLEEGATVPVETVIAVIGKKGEDFQDLLKAAPAAAEEAPAAEVKASASVPVAAPGAPATTAPVVPAASTSSNERVFASPLAKSMAEEKGIDLSLVAGSGDNGRIIKKDIENYVPSAASTAAVGVESFEDVPVSQMRKTIAKRLAESKFSAPHFYLTKEIKMDAVLAARKRMNEYTESRISINDIIVKAAAVALKSHPNITHRGWATE
jgi:pyruvate dehydrogenase E2 component (dihydrolipoamide acetyltransferase)